MGKTKIVIKEADVGYALKANVDRTELLDPLSQVAVGVAVNLDVDKEKYFALLDEIWEQQKSDYAGKQ